jgi:hypothetical protein
LLSVSIIALILARMEIQRGVIYSNRVPDE